MLDMFRVATDIKAADLVSQTLSSGMLGEGPRVVEFTQKLSQLFGNYTLPLNSGTSALTLALRLAGVGPSHVVVSTPFTMIATNVSVAANYASIVWSDVDPRTFSSSLPDLVKLMDIHRPRAVIITCVGGVPPQNLHEIYTACQSYKIPLILDCAHGLNTQYLGSHISNWADFCCFSFQSIKHLSTGDGGALTIRGSLSLRDDIFDRAERIKWFGMTRIVPEGKTRLQHQMTADVPEWGYKFHMNDICASLGLANWDLALQNIEISRRNATLYGQLLADLPGVQPQTAPAGSNPSWWIYGVLVPEGSRDGLIEFLQQNQVVSTPMWRRNDCYSTFSPPYQPLPGMDSIQNRILFIPSGWWVTEDDVRRVARLIKDFVGGLT